MIAGTARNRLEETERLPALYRRRSPKISDLELATTARMKKTILSRLESRVKFIGALVLVVASQPALAGNNYLTTSSAAKTTSGTGAALYLSESAAISENPSLLTLSPRGPGALGLTVGATFLRVASDASPATPTAAGDGPTYRNKFESATLPELASFYRFDDKLTFGLGYLVPSNGAANFEDIPEMLDNRTLFVATNLPIAAAYRVHPDAGVSFAINLTTGMLETTNFGTTTIARKDSKTAFSVGAHYGNQDIGRVGFSYFSGAQFEFTSSTLNLVTQQIGDAKVGLPPQFAIGYSYGVLDELDLSLQFKQFTWTKAEHYKDIGWADENIVSLAGEYRLDDMIKIRAGFALLSGAMQEEKDQNGDEVVDYQGTPTTMFVRQSVNATSGGTANKVLSFGGEFQLMPNLSLNAGYSHAFARKIEQTGTSQLLGPYKASLESSLIQYTLSVDYVVDTGA